MDRPIADLRRRASAEEEEVAAATSRCSRRFRRGPVYVRLTQGSKCRKMSQSCWVASAICDNGRVVAHEQRLSFGELLRVHRHAAGLTQEELAERAGVSPRSISEMERGGPHVPRRDTVSLLARALGLSAQARETLDSLVDQRRRIRPV